MEQRVLFFFFKHCWSCWLHQIIEHEICKEALKKLGIIHFYFTKWIGTFTKPAQNNMVTILLLYMQPFFSQKSTIFNYRFILGRIFKCTLHFLRIPLLERENCLYPLCAYLAKYWTIKLLYRVLFFLPTCLLVCFPGFGLPDEVVIEKKDKGDSFIESTGADVRLSNIKFIQHDAIEGILCGYMSNNNNVLLKSYMSKVSMHQQCL